MNSYYIKIALICVITGQFSKFVSFRQALGEPTNISEMILTIFCSCAVVLLALSAKQTVEKELLTELRRKREERKNEDRG